MAYSQNQLNVHSRVIFQFLAGADIAKFNDTTEKWEFVKEPAFEEDAKYIALNMPVVNAQGVFELAGIVVMSDADVIALRAPSPLQAAVMDLFQGIAESACDGCTDPVCGKDDTTDAAHSDDCDGCPECKPVDVTTQSPAEPTDTVEEEAEDAPVDDAPDVEPAPAPMPDEAPAKFVRGDIWKSREGREYLILGDKAKLDPNYTGTVCKEAQIIVLRLKDDGTSEVSHRNADGTRTFLKSGKPNRKRDLVEKVGSRDLRAVGGANQLIRRTGQPDLYYNADLQETRLQR